MLCQHKWQRCFLVQRFKNVTAICAVPKIADCLRIGISGPLRRDKIFTAQTTFHLFFQHFPLRELPNSNHYCQEPILPIGEDCAVLWKVSLSLQGRPNSKAVARDYPHAVEVEVPPGGFGKRLDAMHELPQAGRQAGPPGAKLKADQVTIAIEATKEALLALTGFVDAHGAMIVTFRQRHISFCTKCKSRRIQNRFRVLVGVSLQIRRASHEKFFDSTCNDRDCGKQRYGGRFARANGAGCPATHHRSCTCLDWLLCRRQSRRGVWRRQRERGSRNGFNKRLRFRWWRTNRL